MLGIRNHDIVGVVPAGTEDVFSYGSEALRLVLGKETAKACFNRPVVEAGSLGFCPGIWLRKSIYKTWPRRHGNPGSLREYGGWKKTGP